jgi:glycosyltransferase involved in cell wall biosynthesis
MTQKPRVLFVGPTKYVLPLAPALARKWDAVSRELDVRIVGQGSSGGDPRFRLVDARGAPFYASLTPIVASELRSFRPSVVLTQSPYEAFACAPAIRTIRPRPRVVVEVHGDWRTAGRIYGSPARRLYAPLADQAAVLALRTADGTRAVGSFTASLVASATGRQPTAVFPAFVDLESFNERPVQPFPEVPSVAWVGALQRTKDPETLVQAWRLVAERMSGARLVIVGRGPLRHIVDALAHELPDQVRVEQGVPSVADLLDASTVLGVTSLSEGLPRVVIEAFSRGRPVVASDVGGIPEMVMPERNGLLVPPQDPVRLAAALERVLVNRDLAEHLARGAEQDAARFESSPEGYARAVRALVETILAPREAPVTAV